MSRGLEIVSGIAAGAAVIVGPNIVEAQQPEAVEAVADITQEAYEQFEKDGIVFALGGRAIGGELIMDAGDPCAMGTGTWQMRDGSLKCVINSGGGNSGGGGGSGSSGGGNSGGGGSGGNSGGSNSGNSGGSGSSGGGNSGGSGRNSGGGGNSGSNSGSNSNGGNTYVAPVLSWDQQIEREYPDKCSADHPIVTYLNPVANEAAGLAGPDQLNIEGRPETHTYEYFLSQLEADRNPEASDEAERGSTRLIRLLETEGCLGLLAPISPSEWTSRGWSAEDYEAYWVREGQAPTDLEIVVNNPDYNITPNDEQWQRVMDEILVIQSRAFVAEGITAEQFRSGERQLGTLPAAGLVNPS